MGLITEALFDPLRLLLYLPLGQAEGEDALIEFKAAGVVLRRGRQPLELWIASRKQSSSVGERYGYGN